MNQDQEARVAEFQTDFCALTESERERDSFWEWIQDYYKYCRWGPEDEEKGGVRPPTKPPI